MSACPGCNSDYRTGVTVTLLDPIKGAERKRVCQRCAAGGLVVVAPRMAPVVKGIARETSDDVAQAVRMLRTYATAAKASRDEFPSTRARPTRSTTRTSPAASRASRWQSSCSRGRRERLQGLRTGPRRAAV